MYIAMPPRAVPDSASSQSRSSGTVLPLRPRNPQTSLIAKKTPKMQTTPKTNITVRQLFAFLAAGATLAIGTLVVASTSHQVEQLDSLVVPRTAHVATA